MADSIPPQVQLEKTYNAAADHPALSFWDRFATEIDSAIVAWLEAIFPNCHSDRAA